MEQPVNIIDETNSGHGVSWCAILAGTIVAAAVSLALVVLGSALGLSQVSPFSNSPETIASFTVKAAIWLIIMQWISSGLGGFITGRLRGRWSNLHNDEVFFRDTAHGFVTWALATIVTAIFLTSTIASVLGTGTEAAAMAGAGAAAKHAGPPPPPHGGPAEDANGYSIDSLFRSANPGNNVPAPESRMEATRILLISVKNNQMTDEDKAYLTNMVANRDGIPPEEASQRVTNSYNELVAAKEKAKEDAEQARKTGMHASLMIFLSMLIGAFIASTAAALGGRYRDQY